MKILFEICKKQQIISETIINYIKDWLYQGQLVFLNKKNSGNGHATDDENNESNNEDISTDEEKNRIWWKKGIWKLLFLKVPDI